MHIDVLFDEMWNRWQRVERIRNYHPSTYVGLALTRPHYPHLRIWNRDAQSLPCTISHLRPHSHYCMVQLASASAAAIPQYHSTA